MQEEPDFHIHFHIQQMILGAACTVILIHLMVQNYLLHNYVNPEDYSEPTMACL